MKVVQNTASKVISSAMGDYGKSIAEFVKYKPDDPVAQRIMAGLAGAGIFAVCASFAYVLYKNNGIRLIIEEVKSDA